MGEKQGWIVLGTKMDNKQLVKDLKAERKMLEEYEEQTRVLLNRKSRYEADLKGYDDEKKQLKELKKQYEDIEQQIDKYFERQKEITKLPEAEQLKIYKEDETASFRYVNNLMQERAKLYTDIFDKETHIKTGTKVTKKYLEQTNEELRANLSLQDETAQKIDNIQTKMKANEINAVLKNISKNLTATIKKVIRWGLAIFGIRGAYMAVRNAINVISQDDEKLKADINYIKTAFAYTLEPIVRKIVELAKEFMYAIQYIAYVLTGKNIFANANKSLDNANKKAQALSKTIAGFDEMNVVNGGGGSDNGTPSFDLTQMHDLSNTGKGIVGIIGAIAGAITAMKLSELLKTLGLINSELTIMQGLGIFLLILSIYNIVLDLIEIWNKFDETLANNNTTLKDWGDVLLWVGLGIVGVALLIGALPLAVVGAIVAIIALIMKNWDTIKTFFTEKVFGWLDNQIEKLNKTTLGKFFATFLEETKRVIGQVINVFDGLFKGLKQIFDGIVLIFKGKIGDGLWSIAKGLINLIISGINLLVAGLNTLVAPFRALIVGFGKIAGKNWSMENIRFPQIRYLAKGGIINQPGRGVPLANGLARGGEEAPEGVIPLTDSQQMALLGEAIGKYVTINATIPVYAYNRMVDRKIERIKAEDNFAYNR